MDNGHKIEIVYEPTGIRIIYLSPSVEYGNQLFVPYGAVGLLKEKLSMVSNGG